MPGLYIHIPFCISKCPYCDFNSYAGKLEYEQKYIKSLIKESEAFKGSKISTIYIGGGTPTCIKTQNILYLVECIHKIFNVQSDAEITIESNPATIDIYNLKSLYNAGINRISIGVQSFNSDMLKTLGRAHSSDEAKRGIFDAIDAGFKNISIDLMFSLPGQTKDMWVEDLSFATGMDITHISCYGLKVEQGTPFYNEGINPLSEDIDRELYHIAISHLAKHGFHQYEISNFAKECKYSKHNMLYWKCQEYIGLGAGAHSFLNGERYNNITNLEDYIDKALRGFSLKENIVNLTTHDIYVEKLIMGLRLNSGVEKDVFINLKCEDKIWSYIKSGHLIEKKDKIAFTTKGFDVSNYILSDLI